MLEKTEEILKGFMIIKRILKAKTAIIGIEDNKENAANFFNNKIQEHNLQDKIKVEILHTKYPQGSEKTLIYALTKREVPSGGLPMDIGCVVSNVQTAKAIYDAVWL
jgi:electron transport complex protein RnfC